MSYPQYPGYPQHPQHPQQHGGGYGPPGYYPPQAPPPKKKGFPVWAIVIVAIIGLLFSCGIVAAIVGPSPNPTTASPNAKPSSAATVVQIKDLLDAYKGNELRADSTYKEKIVEVRGGKVDDVKKDILDKPYITIGTGGMLEIPQIQCTDLDSSQAVKAVQLNKGQSITIRGRVTGLMMNVLLEDCEIL
jgi:hypothetical protein